MRWMITFVGILTILGGLIPLLKTYNVLQSIIGFIPTEGLGYQIIIILIGVIAVVYGVRVRRFRRVL